MERKRRITVHWGVLLIVYVAILFATSMVVLTSGSVDGYYLLLLAAGVPIYLIASKAIMCDERNPGVSSTESQGEAKGSNVVAFPDTSAKLSSDISHLRKLG